MTACIATKYGQVFSVCPNCDSHDTKLETLPLDDSFSGYMVCNSCEKIWWLRDDNVLEKSGWVEVEETYIGRHPVDRPIVLMNSRGVGKGIT